MKQNILKCATVLLLSQFLALQPRILGAAILLMLIFDFGYVDKQLHIPYCRKQRRSVLINVYSVIVGVIYERNTLKEIISQTD